VTAADAVKKLATPLALASHVGVDVAMVRAVRQKALKETLGDTSSKGLEGINSYLLNKFRRECEESGQLCDGEILNGFSLEERRGACNGENDATKLGILAFPYLRSITRHQDGLVMWTCAAPLLVGELAKATEWQIDVTYNEMTRENQKPFYLLNVCSFSATALRWLTPIRIRLNSKREEAYVHAFKSLREVLRDDCPLFSVTSLQCVLFDFELGLSNAFSKVFGQDMDGVVKGCEVHWQRSAKAQSDKVTQGREERRLWWTMVKKVPQVKTRTDFVHLFEALCGGDLDPIRHLFDDITNFTQLARTNWHKSEAWAKFFLSDKVAKMLNKEAHGLNPTPGSKNDNAMESQNGMGKDGKSRPPVLATITVHELDMRIVHEVFMVECGGQHVLRANSPAKRVMKTAGRGQPLHFEEGSEGSIDNEDEDLLQLSDESLLQTVAHSQNDDTEYWEQLSRTPEKDQMPTPAMDRFESSSSSTKRNKPSSRLLSKDWVLNAFF